MRNLLNYLSLPLIAAIILYVAFFVGVEPSPEPSGEPGQPSADKPRITLRISHIWGQSNLIPDSEPKNTKELSERRALEHFRKTRGVDFKIHMGLKMAGPGGEAGIMMSLAAGTAGEILYTNYRSVDTFVRQGFYLELDPYFEKWIGELLVDRYAEVDRDLPALLTRLGISRDELKRLRERQRQSKDPKPSVGYKIDIHELDRKSHSDTARLVSILTHFPRQAWDVIYREGLDGEKHIYAIPYKHEVATLAYRKDLFIKAGLDPNKPPKTWDEVREFAIQLTDPGRHQYGMPLYPGPWRWQNLVWSAGGDILEEVTDPKTGEKQWTAVFGEMAGLKALEELRKRAAERKQSPEGETPVFFPIPPGKSDDDFFRDGTIAMKYHNVNHIVIGLEPMDVTGIALLPAGPDGIHGSEVNSASFAINISVKDKPEVAQAAWDYLMFMASEERARIIVDTYVANGEARSINPKWLKKFYPKKDYYLQVDPQWEQTIDEALKHGKPEPYGKNSRYIYDTVKAALSKGVLLEKHAAFTYADLRKQLDNVIAKVEAETAAESPDAKTQINRWSDLFTQGEIDQLAAHLKEKGSATYAYDRKDSVELAEKVQRYLAAEGDPRAEKFQADRLAYNLDRLVLLESLRLGVEETDIKLLDRFPEEVLKRDRIIALIVVFVIFAGGIFGGYRIVRAAQSGPKGSIRRASGSRRTRAMAWVFMSAALGSILLWQYLPLAFGAVMAFLDYTIMGGADFVGFDNFIHVLHEKTFWISLKNTFVYAFMSLAIGFFLPIILAVLLTEIPRFKLLLRTVYFLPAVTSGLVIAFLWMRMYDPGPTGFINTLVLWFDNTVWIGLFGADGPLMGRQSWLGDPKLAMLCVIIPGIWAGTGPGCIIYLAALKAVPEEIYEAADIDGASAFRKFFHITLPTLKPLIIINFVGAFIGSFRAMENVLVMTGGGPDNATRLLGLEVFFNAFGFLRYGYATAVGWIMGSLLIGFTMYQLRILRNVRFTTAGRA